MEVSLKIGIPHWIIHWWDFHGFSLHHTALGVPPCMESPKYGLRKFHDKSWNSSLRALRSFNMIEYVYVLKWKHCEYVNEFLDILCQGHRRWKPIRHSSCLQLYVPYVTLNAGEECSGLHWFDGFHGFSGTGGIGWRFRNRHITNHQSCTI